MVPDTGPFYRDVGEPLTKGGIVVDHVAIFR